MKARIPMVAQGFWCQSELFKPREKTKDDRAQPENHPTTDVSLVFIYAVSQQVFIVSSEPGTVLGSWDFAENKQIKKVG